MQKPVFKVVKVSASWCSNCRLVNWGPEDGETWDFDRLTDDQQLVMSKITDVKELPVFIMFTEDNPTESIVRSTIVGYIGGIHSRKEVDEWIIKTIMDYLATFYNYDKSEHFDKIANARLRMGLNWNQCPCGGEERGCISDLCHKEIAEQGHCHCNCYLRKEN